MNNTEVSNAEQFIIFWLIHFMYLTVNVNAFKVRTRLCVALVPRLKFLFLLIGHSAASSSAYTFLLSYDFCKISGCFSFYWSAFHVGRWPTR